MSSVTERRDIAVDTDKRIDRMERRALLSALWMFVFLNFIFRDLHEIAKDDFLAHALNGIYDGREVTFRSGQTGGPTSSSRNSSDSH